MVSSDPAGIRAGKPSDGVAVSARTPVLWLTGAPGVGKTTVAWELYGQLARAGVATGYVDIDQLGMCYPESAADPGRHRLKERNLASMVDGFAAYGADCVVVSGVVDPDHGVRTEHLSRAELTVCLLTARPDELGQRFVGRTGQHDLVTGVLAEADQLAASDHFDIRVDTSGRSVAEVVRIVRERTSWPPPWAGARPSRPAPNLGAEATDGRVLWLCGPTGVGKSTVGFRAYLTTMSTGATAAYVDLRQLGFVHPLPDQLAGHRLKAHNLAVIWRNYHRVGARLLIVTGPAEDERAIEVYADALPGATHTVCRLHAGPTALTERILRRTDGGSWAEPGDPLKGQLDSYLRRVAERAVADAEALERMGLGDVRIDTDGLDPAEVVDRVIAKTNWPAPPDDPTSDDPTSDNPANDNPANDKSRRTETHRR